jgi:hypothetical protein
MTKRDASISRLRLEDSSLVMESAAGRYTCPLRVQTVWKRFSYPNNCKQPGAMDLEATG